MKRFKKEISLLLTVALVVSSLAVGLGQITSKAYTDATGTGVFRVDIGIGTNDCANDHRGTDSSFRLQFLNAGGSVVCATPDNALNGGSTAGDGGTNPLENGQTTSFTFNGAAYGSVNETVPSLGTLAVNKSITQVQLVNTSWSDDWVFNNVVIYYSYDGGTNWVTLANNGWTNTSAGAVATWSVGTYFTGSYKTLTFNANGGSPDTYLDAIPGQTINTANAMTPSRTGYTFAGWQSVPARMPNAAATYYAQWTANTNTITYYSNDGTGRQFTQQVTTGLATVASCPWTRTGYTYSGWNTVSNGSGTSYASGSSVMVTGNISLYAQWSPISYTVHYNGGTGVSGSTANSSHTYNIPKNLTANGFEKTGYTFQGWSLTDGGALAFTNGQSVSNLTAANGATVELYARWTPYTYYVFYDPVNPDVSGTTPTSVHTIGVSSPLSMNGFYRTGYTYQGWSTSPGGSPMDLNGSSDLDSLVSFNYQTIALNASWEANTYTIYFNGNGATSGYMPPVTFIYDVMFILPPNSFSRTGYTFVGWALSPTGPVVNVNQANIVNLTTSGSITLYAKWTANTYTITYNGNGSTGGSTSNSIHTYDVAKNLNANGYTKTGHTFLGWSLTNSATEPAWTDQLSVLNLTSINGATLTLYAVWQTNYYNITFDANGGTGGTEPTAMEYGSPLTAPTVTKIGYDFAGWTPSVPATVPAAYTTYVAQWTPKTIVIIFDPGPGTGGGTFYLHYGDPMPMIPPVTYTGHTFIGWSPTVPPFMPTQSMTFTAQWEVNYYTITFDASGGTSQSLAYGSTLIPPTVERTGYTFAGWLPIVPPTVGVGNKTYVAQWSIDQYTISFDSNGGTGTIAPIMGDFNTTITLPSNGFTRAGYNLDHWNTTANDAGTSYDLGANFTIPAYNVTLYAIWTYADADYGPINELINRCRAATLPANAANDPGYMAPDGDMYIMGGFTNGGYYSRAMFTPESIDAMEDAIGRIYWGLNSSQQAIVNGSYAEILAAYNNIALSSADYSTLNVEIAQAEALDRDIYTEDSLNMLDAALMDASDALADEYKMPLQVIVDDRADALQNALSSMEYLPADYSEIDYIWANKPADLSIYTDESVANLINFYNSINRNQPIYIQPDIDECVGMLIYLINALVLKPADYHLVHQFLISIPDNDCGLESVNWAYLYTVYTAASVDELKAFVDSIVWGRTILDQTIVDNYALEISIKFNGLVPLNADYTYLGIALNNESAWPASYYTDATYIPYTDALAAGRALYNNQNLNIMQQDIINDATAAINAAYAELQELVPYIDIPITVEPPFELDPDMHFIYGLTEGMTKADFEALSDGIIVGNGRLEITPYDEFGQFGTGTRVELIDNATDEVVDTYYIVIFGDLNGDGVANLVDGDIAYNVDNWFIEWDSETQPFLFIAGDLNGDGSVNLVDGDILYNCDNWVMYIDQSTGLAYAS